MHRYRPFDIGLGKQFNHLLQAMLQFPVLGVRSTELFQTSEHPSTRHIDGIAAYACHPRDVTCRQAVQGRQLKSLIGLGSDLFADHLKQSRQQVLLKDRLPLGLRGPATGIGPLHAHTLREFLLAPARRNFLLHYLKQPVAEPAALRIVPKHDPVLEDGQQRLLHDVVGRLVAATASPGEGIHRPPVAREELAPCQGVPAVFDPLEESQPGVAVPLQTISSSGSRSRAIVNLHRLDYSHRQSGFPGIRDKSGGRAA